MTGTAFDDEGFLMPGVVDANAALEDQQAQLAARLQQQGLSAQQSQQTAQAHYATPIFVRDEAVREARQADDNDQALRGLDSFEPGTSSELLADADSATPSRLLRLQSNLVRLAEADSLFLVERNQAVVRVQIDKYQALEAQALQSGDTVLARALRDERTLLDSTLVRLEQRAVEIDYRGAALRYAGELASRSGSPFSAQQLTQAMQRLVAGTSANNGAADEYLRRQLASDDKRLWLTIMGGGSIASLLGSDTSGTGAPLLRRTPNGSVQIPGSGHNYKFDQLGRVDTASAKLQLGSTTRNGNLQREAGGTDRRTTDDGGHIVGNRFNPPTEEFNLFAQNANFNRGAYRSLEGQWANALAQGQAVKVEWKFEYTGSSLRPDSLTVRYTVGNQGAVEIPFRNSPRGGK